MLSNCIYITHLKKNLFLKLVAFRLVCFSQSLRSNMYGKYKKKPPVLTHLGFKYFLQISKKRVILEPAGFNKICTIFFFWVGGYKKINCLRKYWKYLFKICWVWKTHFLYCHQTGKYSLCNFEKKKSLGHFLTTVSVI